MDELEREHHQLELLRLLARREKEIEAGKGYDLDTVFAEADALLRKMSRRKHPRTNEQ